MSRYSQIETFYKAVLDGHVVKVEVKDIKEYNSIRTALHRYHRLVREIGGSEFSLLAHLEGTEASYRLGDRKNQRKEYVFKIEESDGKEI